MPTVTKDLQKTRTIFKPCIFNIEAEETWLNEMASTGAMMTNQSFGNYTFTEASAQEREYTYRIVLLAHKPEDKRNRELINTAARNDFELVHVSLSRAYFRKKGATEASVFADNEAELIHLVQAKNRRVFLLVSYIILAVCSLMACSYFWPLTGLFVWISSSTVLILVAYMIVLNAAEGLALKRAMSRISPAHN